MCPSVWREVVALSLPLCVFVFVCLCLCVSLPLCVFVFVCPSVFFAECASVAWGGGAQDWTNIVK